MSVVASMIAASSGSWRSRFPASSGLTLGHQPHALDEAVGGGGDRVLDVFAERNNVRRGLGLHAQARLTNE
jgi:hypothetical protein